MGILLFVLPFVCSYFFLSKFFVKDISTTVEDLFFIVFVLFSYSPDFSSKISPQPFKIETSNLVYRFSTTSYNVGLKMGILLFVLHCIFLSLYIFHLRYQPYALEALKRGYSQIF